MKRAGLAAALLATSLLLGGCAAGSLTTTAGPTAAAAPAAGSSLQPAEFAAAAKLPDTILLDVRTPAEHARGAIPGSSNIPLDDLRDHLGELRGTDVVVYCEVGQRGHTATALLLESGITARNLDGGYRTWSAAARAARPLPSSAPDAEVEAREPQATA